MARDEAPGTSVEHLTLELAGVTVEGDLVVPATADAVIAFAHGSGSSRHSPRNREVADGLHRADIATLLFDLLTAEEAADRHRVFDIPLLGGRLAEVVDLLSEHPRLASLPLGLFGASTGAAAALDAAAERPEQVRAIVSRGGRPDLGSHLPGVGVPVLLVVGGADRTVLQLNREASEQLGGEHEILVIEGAGHLFEGPGELAQVTEHAVRWFRRHLTEHG